MRRRDGLSFSTVFPILLPPFLAFFSGVLQPEGRDGGRHKPFDVSLIQAYV